MWRSKTPGPLPDSALPSPCLGAKPGANVLGPTPAQPDATSPFAQVRGRGPRSGFAQIRAYPLDLLRDEEAAGSNPATPTIKLQVAALFRGNFAYSSRPLSGFGSEREPTLPSSPR